MSSSRHSPALPALIALSGICMAGAIGLGLTAEYRSEGVNHDQSYGPTNNPQCVNNDKVDWDCLYFYEAQNRQGVASAAADVQAKRAKVQTWSDLSVTLGLTAVALAVCGVAVNARGNENESRPPAMARPVPPPAAPGLPHPGYPPPQQQ